jgi:hypothetical protein
MIAARDGAVNARSRFYSSFIFSPREICRIVRDIFSAFTTPKRQRHVLLLSMLTLTLISNVTFGVNDETFLRFEK